MSGAELGIFENDEPLEGKRLPKGLTIEQAERLQSLVAELRSGGLHIAVGVADAQGKVFSVIRARSSVLNPMLVKMAEAAAQVCPCPTCEAKRAASAARAN